MKKIFKIFKTLIVIVLVYTCYGEYEIKKSKKEHYENYTTLMLQSYCGEIITNKFNEHASRFSTGRDKNHFLDGEQRLGDLMSVHGHSVIYFEGYAPQDITCSATMPLDTKMEAISLNTKIEVSIFGISYLPSGYSNPKSITLTIKQLNQLYPLSFAATFHFSKLQQSIFNGLL